MTLSGIMAVLTMTEYWLLDNSFLLYVTCGNIYTPCPKWEHYNEAPVQLKAKMWSVLHHLQNKLCSVDEWCDDCLLIMKELTIVCAGSELSIVSVMLAHHCCKVFNYKYGINTA